MAQHHGQCGVTPSDSLASMCWPIIRQHKPLGLMEKVALSSRPPQEGINWPVGEPWRRNLGQPRCGGQGRCQGEARRCNSKYRYGVDDVGPCPTSNCGVTCNPCPPPCPEPCPDSTDCQRQGRQPRQKRAHPVDSKAHRIDLYDPIHAKDPRLTTRCFDWPRPKKESCPKEKTDVDCRGPRANLNSLQQPKLCPTCHRTLVDMQAGPLGYNY